MSIKKKMLLASAGSSNVGAWDLSFVYYNDPNSWDISTATFTAQYNVSTESAYLASGIYISPDGTKMYVSQLSREIRQYTLSTPWLISTASYVANAFIGVNPPAGDTFTSDIFFKPDGTVLYIVGATNDVILEYSLSTPWDITTISYVRGRSIASQDTNALGLFFRADGAKMYITGSSSRSVHEYSLSTPWNISTTSYVQSFDVNSQETEPEAISFKDDGTIMYIVGSVGDDINQYSLSTPWDISTASYVKNFSVVSQERRPNGIFFKPDGYTVYIAGDDSITADVDRVHQYTLGGFRVTAQETAPNDIFFKPDGTKMYVVGSVGDDVNEYNLSTAWDTSTATFLQSFTLLLSPAPQGLFFRADGTKMYTIDSNDDTVDEYTLSTPWNVSTASYVQNFSVAAQTGSKRDVFFKTDGTKMYTLEQLGTSPFAATVSEYNLSTPWDISTASYLQNLDIFFNQPAGADSELNPTDFFFKPDGTKMYISGTFNGVKIQEFNLNPAWDVSSATFVQKFTNLLDSPTGIFFKGDGTALYTVSSISDKVQTYSLGIQE